MSVSAIVIVATKGWKSLCYAIYIYIYLYHVHRTTYGSTGKRRKADKRMLTQAQQQQVSIYSANRNILYILNPMHFTVRHKLILQNRALCVSILLTCRVTYSAGTYKLMPYSNVIISRIIHLLALLHWPFQFYLLTTNKASSIIASLCIMEILLQ